MEDADDRLPGEQGKRKTTSLALVMRRALLCVVKIQRK
jgi:hypothetical protein